VPQKEIIVREAVQKLLREIEDKQFCKDMWDNSDDYGAKVLRDLKNQFKVLGKDLDKNQDSWDEEKCLEKTMEKEHLEKQILQMEEERDQIGKDLAKLKSQKRAKEKRLKNFKKMRRSAEDSIYTGIDKILKKYGINRAAYHGGDLNGGGVLMLMEYSTEIMKEIGAYLVESKSEKSRYSDDEILCLCDSYAHLLTVWDGALSESQAVDSDESNYKMAGEFIKKGVSIIREMDLMSVTPKVHGMEDHVVNQMRKTEGGIGELGEHWVELYHQTGYRYDVSLRAMKDEKKKAQVISKREKASINPNVMKAKEMKMKRFTPKKRSSTLEREDANQRVKRERREGALQKPFVKCESFKK